MNKNQRHNLWILILIIGMGSIFASCNNDDTPPEDDNTPKTELEGTWKKGCYQNTNDGSYYTESTTMSGNNTTFTLILYLSDYTCANKLASMTMTDSFIIGEASNGTKTIDSTIQSIKWTYHTAEQATYGNTNVMYGYVDWQAEVPKEISGKGNVPTIGTIVYDIYKIEGNILSMGENTSELDGTTEAKRPVDFESSGYAKQ